MTHRAPRVLVTSAGGDLGQALIKALRLADPAFALFGCDADSLGIAGAFVERFRPIPLASNRDRYLESLEALCREWGVDAVVPASEPELALLSGLGSPPRLACGAVIVSQDGPAYRLLSDKRDCLRALAGKVLLAHSADGSDPGAVARLVEKAGFPLVVKSRRSSGSKSLRLAHDGHGLAAALEEVRDPLVQEWIGDEDGEFSVGAYVGTRFTAFAAFRRSLGPAGCSWYAESSDDLDVLSYARAVVEAAGARGSVNVQVRKGLKGVLLLEINPRFSSLVAARAFCGFRDAEWSVNEALGLDTPVQCPPLDTIRFRRFFDELVDTGGGFYAVDEWRPRGRPPGPDGGGTGSTLQERREVD